MDRTSALPFEAVSEPRNWYVPWPRRVLRAIAGRTRDDVGMPSSVEVDRPVATQSVLEVACDESGSDGENLFESRHRVFAHGSVDLSKDEADVVLRYVRQQFGFGGEELKASRLLRAASLDDVGALFAGNGPLHGRAHVYLLDKLYFAVAKIIDLLVEEDAHERGVNLHDQGKAREMASVLFTHGRQALGGPNWDRLVGAFVSFIRRRQRTGVKTTLDDYYAVVDDVRLRSHREDVTDVLAFVWAARHQAFQYDPASNDYLDRPNLEPILAALYPTASYWAEQHERPVLLVHDRQTVITSEMTDLVVMTATHPHPDFPFFVPLAGISQADSKADSRVQLADLTAGFGRLIGERALAGTLPEALVGPARAMIDEHCVWDDGPSWLTLTGRAIGT
ncbi:MAG: hypothetical protein ACOH17_04335 [Cellulomonas sp.]